MQFPEDGAMLLSFLNMKLRDEYPSFEALVEDTEADGEELLARMLGFGYRYDGALNRFVHT